MKTYLFLLISTITFSVLACNSPAKQSPAEIVEEATQELEEIAEVVNTGNKDIEKDYDNLYFYKSKARDVDQILYVKYNTEDKSKIFFKLVIVRENCEYEISGEAKTNNSGDAEIDEDADGNAYMAIEFKFENKEHFLAIRIAENKEMSKISYVRNDSGKEKCAFVKDELMYSE